MKGGSVKVLGRWLFGFLAISLSVCSANAEQTAPPTQPGIWTEQDLLETGRSALEIFPDLTERLRTTPALVSLANALAGAGNAELVKDVLDRARAGLPTRSDFRAIELLVNRYAAFGYTTEAEALIDPSYAPIVKVSLLGGLATGYVQAGNTAVDGIVSEMQAAREASRGVPVSFEHDPDRALFGTALFLAEAGETHKAWAIAQTLSNEFRKLDILREVAHQICRPAKKSVPNPDLVKTAERLGGRLINPMHRAGKLTPMTGDRSTLIMVAYVLADCADATQAKNNVNRIADSKLAEQAFDVMASYYFEKHDIELARALTPPPDSHDAGSLITVSRMMSRLGEKDEAASLAIKALAVWRPSDTSAAGELVLILGPLLDADRFEDALLTVEKMDVAYRKQQYLDLVQNIVEKKNTIALHKVLVAVVEGLRGTAPRDDDLRKLADLLAVNGYREDAKSIFDRLAVIPVDQEISGPDQVYPSAALAFRAEMGDVDGALADSAQLGPLVKRPNEAQMPWVLSAYFLKVGKKPTPEERKLAAEFVMMPDRQADALEGIAKAMAAKGNIPAALAAVARMEVEPRQALNTKVDSCLYDIFQRQFHDGDYKGAYATAMRVSYADMRWELLLKLAAIHST